MWPRNLHRWVMLLFPLVAALAILAISLVAHLWLLATGAAVLLPVELAIGLYNERKHWQRKEQEAAGDPDATTRRASEAGVLGRLRFQWRRPYGMIWPIALVLLVVGTVIWVTSGNWGAFGWFWIVCALLVLIGLWRQDHPG